MIKLKDIIKDSVIEPLLEEETYNLKSKESGKIVTFTNKDNYKDALKGGDYEDPEDSKSGEEEKGEDDPGKLSGSDFDRDGDDEKKLYEPTYYDDDPEFEKRYGYEPDAHIRSFNDEEREEIINKMAKDAGVSVDDPIELVKIVRGKDEYGNAALGDIHKHIKDMADKPKADKPKVDKKSDFSPEVQSGVDDFTKKIKDAMKFNSDYGDAAKEVDNVLQNIKSQGIEIESVEDNSGAQSTGIKFNLKDGKEISIRAMENDNALMGPVGVELVVQDEKGEDISNLLQKDESIFTKEMRRIRVKI